MMKKLLLLALFSLLCFACNDDNDDGEALNLSGTEWRASTPQVTDNGIQYTMQMTLSFTSKKFLLEAEGIYEGVVLARETAEGTYVYKHPKLTLMDSERGYATGTVSEDYILLDDGDGVMKLSRIK